MSSEVALVLQQWARQTIAFAISLRDDPDWVALPEIEQASRAQDEADEVARQLWETAQRATAAPSRTKVFLAALFQWVRENTPDAT